MAYELTTDFVYPLSELYEGVCNKATFVFDAPPVGTEWYADYMLDKFEEECSKQEASMLRLRIYEDHAPLTVTKFYCEAWLCGSPLPAWAIAAIITACLIALGIVTSDILKIIETHWPEIAKITKWVAIGVASVATIVVARLLAEILPKRKKVKA